jgi:hypothetical protein
MGSGDLISSEDVGLTDLPPVAIPGDPLTGADATQADGTIGINGLITINAPTSTPAGVYVGTVTITVET